MFLISFEEDDEETANSNKEGGIRRVEYSDEEEEDFNKDGGILFIEDTDEEDVDKNEGESSLYIRGSKGRSPDRKKGNKHIKRKELESDQGVVKFLDGTTTLNHESDDSDIDDYDKTIYDSDDESYYNHGIDNKKWNYDSENESYYSEELNPTRTAQKISYGVKVIIPSSVPRRPFNPLHVLDYDEFEDMLADMREFLPDNAPSLIENTKNYSMYDSCGKHVATFKTKTKRGTKIQRFFQSIKKLLFPCMDNPGADRLSPYTIEVLASVVDEFFGLQVVPLTKIEKIERRFLEVLTFKDNKINLDKKDSNTTDQYRMNLDIENNERIKKGKDKIKGAIQTHYEQLNQLPNTKNIFDVLGNNTKLKEELFLSFERIIVLDYLLGLNRKIGEISYYKNMLVDRQVDGDKQDDDDDDEASLEGLGIRLFVTENNRIGFNRKNYKWGEDMFKRRFSKRFGDILRSNLYPFKEWGNNKDGKKIEINKWKDLEDKIERIYKQDVNYNKNGFNMEMNLLRGRMFNLLKCIERKDRIEDIFNNEVLTIYNGNNTKNIENIDIDNIKLNYSGWIDELNNENDKEWWIITGSKKGNIAIY